MRKNTKGSLHTRVIIIGSGPAGYTAAIYSARACLDPIMICGSSKGGQLVTTTDVENYPGFVEPILGQNLMDSMELQSRRLGVQIVDDHVIGVNFKKQPFEIYTETGEYYTADSVIIATGATAKWLGLESETKFKGYGVSGCATCDGFFYRGKDVLVVGGGNTAVEDALYLTNHAKKVTLIHRGEKLKAEQMLQRKLLSHPKICIIFNTILEEVLGIEQPPLRVHSAIITNTKTAQKQKIDVDGIFIAIGHSPATSLFVDTLDIDDEGYIITKTPNSTKTSVDGVFAAGDVQDKIFRQAVTAAGSGCMAALEAERYLSREK